MPGKQAVATLIEVQGNRCFYCESLLNTGSLHSQRTVDHIIPKSLGGKSNLGNLVLCCHRCNGLKGNKSLDLWIDEVEASRCFTYA